MKRKPKMLIVCLMTIGCCLAYIFSHSYLNILVPYFFTGKFQSLTETILDPSVSSDTTSAIELVLFPVAIILAIPFAYLLYRILKSYMGELDEKTYRKTVRWVEITVTLFGWGIMKGSPLGIGAFDIGFYVFFSKLKPVEKTASGVCGYSYATDDAGEQQMVCSNCGSVLYGAPKVCQNCNYEIDYNG